MKRFTVYCLLLTVFSMRLMSQVTVDASVSGSVAESLPVIFIGQRADIALQVSAAKGADVALPEYDSLQQIVAGVEVVRSGDVDTSYINDGERMLLTRHYLVTSFDSALYYLPPMYAVCGGDTTWSESLALKVISFEVDSLRPDSIFGMKGMMRPVFAWEDWRSLLWLSAAVLLLTIALLYVAIRLKDNKPIIRRIRVKPKLAPHKAAMQKIECIKAEKIWQQEDSKEYYTRLTDTLRQYMDERYGFNAMEMTTPEIIEHVSEVNDPEAVNELRELFETADLVKFAKYSTLLGENDRNLVNAIEYINATKKEEPATPQPTEIVVVEKRGKVSKSVLAAAVTVAAVALIAVACYLAMRIWLLI